MPVNRPGKGWRRMKRIYVEEEWCLGCHLCEYNCAFANSGLSDMVKAAIAGVLVIHVIGILYMAVVALFRHAGFMFVGGWIAAQSGLKIIYDILFSFVLIVAGKYIHSGLSYIIK